MGRVKTGSLRLREAGELLELSYRQVKRVWARYRGGGPRLCNMRTAGGGRIGRTRRSFGKRCWLGCESAMRISVPRCGASGQRRQAEDSCRELAALDAGSRLV